MKTKIIPASILVVVLSIASMFLGYNLDCVLSGRQAACSGNFVTALQGVIATPKARAFFLIFLAISVLFIASVLAMQGYIKYKSDMRQITPELATPAAAGQGQYGTARWLENSQFASSFAVVHIDERSELMRALLQQAYEN